MEGFHRDWFYEFSKRGSSQAVARTEDLQWSPGVKIPAGGHGEIVITKLKQHEISVHMLTFSYSVGFRTKKFLKMQRCVDSP